MIYVQMNDSSENEHDFSRKLLDTALMREYGKHLSDFEMITHPSGKPYFKNCDIHFNISHTKNAAAVIVSDSPVGIDIQKILTYNPRLAERICTEEEIKAISVSSDKAFMLYSFWAMRESYVKYTGEGLRMKIRDIDFSGKSHIYRIKDFVISVSPEPLEINLVG